jgi:Yip1 domain
MSEAPATLPPQAEARGMSLPARVVGILTSPRETFADVVARPRWFGMMALVLVVTALCFGVFFWTQVGQTAFLDQAVEQARKAGREIPEAQWAVTQKMATYMWIIYPVATFVFAPVFWLIVCGLLFAVFNAALGGTATFRQLWAVFIHSTAVSVVQQLLVWPMNYARESMSSATNLAVFLPMLDESSFLAKFLGAIDLFLIWWIVVLSIGLGVLFKRKTGPIAAGLLVVYGVIAVIIAAFFGRGGA